MSFKVARYKCCRNIVMSCVSGMEDEEIECDFFDYVAKGLVVEIIESMDGEKFAKCSCEKIPRAEYDRLLNIEGEHRNKSPRWRPTSTNGVRRTSYLTLRDWKRVCYSHEFIGRQAKGEK